MGKHSDIIDSRDFNEALNKQKVPLPWRDSPGDSGVDESREANLGKNFLDSPDADSEEEPVLADTPAELEDNTDEDLDPAMAQNSKRPDPKDDKDSDTSTH